MSIDITGWWQFTYQNPLCSSLSQFFLPHLTTGTTVGDPSAAVVVVQKLPVTPAVVRWTVENPGGASVSVKVVVSSSAVVVV